MNRLLSPVWTIALLTAVVFPTVGPLVDHHFAERHPAHRHVGRVAVHTHDNGADHAHGEAGTAPTETTALYDHGGHMGSVLTLMVVDSALHGPVDFDPASVFNIPAASQVRPPDHPPAPPDRPPQTRA